MINDETYTFREVFLDMGINTERIDNILKGKIGFEKNSFNFKWAKNIIRNTNRLLQEIHQYLWDLEGRASTTLNMLLTRIIGYYEFSDKLDNALSTLSTVFESILDHHPMRNRDEIIEFRKERNTLAEKIDQMKKENKDEDKIRSSKKWKRMIWLKKEIRIWNILNSISKSIDAMRRNEIPTISVLNHFFKPVEIEYAFKFIDSITQYQSLLKSTYAAFDLVNHVTERGKGFRYIRMIDNITDMITQNDMKIFDIMTYSYIEIDKHERLSKDIEAIKQMAANIINESFNIFDNPFVTHRKKDYITSRFYYHFKKELSKIMRFTLGDIVDPKIISVAHFLASSDLYTVDNFFLNVLGIESKTTDIQKNLELVLTEIARYLSRPKQEFLVSIIPQRAKNFLLNVFLKTVEVSNWLKMNDGHVTCQKIFEELFPDAEFEYSFYMRCLNKNTTIRDFMAMIPNNIINLDATADALLNVGIPSISNILESLIISSPEDTSKPTFTSALKSIVNYAYSLSLVVESGEATVGDLAIGEIMLIVQKVIRYIDHFTVSDVLTIIIGHDSTTMFLRALSDVVKNCRQQIDPNFFITGSDFD